MFNNTFDDGFCNWLSGFVDGEGHFGLQGSHKGPGTFSARFILNLRADDIEIVHKIKDYFKCGYIYLKKPIPNGNPQVSYQIHDLDNLVSRVIPHFDKYTLRAKKARDFKIWRECVIMFHQIKVRPRINKGYLKGRSPSWNQDEIDYYLELCKTLKDTRKYSDDSIKEFKWKPKTTRTKDTDGYLFIT